MLIAPRLNRACPHVHRAGVSGSSKADSMAMSASVLPLAKFQFKQGGWYAVAVQS